MVDRLGGCRKRLLFVNYQRDSSAKTLKDTKGLSE